MGFFAFSLSLLFSSFVGCASVAHFVPQLFWLLHIFHIPFFYYALCRKKSIFYITQGTFGTTHPLRVTKAVLFTLKLFTTTTNLEIWSSPLILQKSLSNCLAPVEFFSPTLFLAACGSRSFWFSSLTSYVEENCLLVFSRSLYLYLYCGADIRQSINIFVILLTKSLSGGELWNIVHFFQHLNGYLVHTS